jgi:hypothetical protein
MSSQKRRRRDTWVLEQDADGLLVSRRIRDGWVVEHRVVLQGVTPVIAETRVRGDTAGHVPAGGIDSGLLRAATVRGVREAAARRLLTDGSPDADLRALESVSPSAKRRGDARRWSLALTSLAYVRAVRAGSPRPNEDAARALGIGPVSVRDRLYAARRTEPPLLTGGGRKGVVGTPELTQAARDVLEERLKRVAASLGLAPGETGLLGYEGSIAGFDATMEAILKDAEVRIPGFWELDLDEVVRRAKGNVPAWVGEVKTGKQLLITPEGARIIDRPGPPE